MDAKDLERIEITEEMVEEALESPGDFGYHGTNDEMFETWSIGPVIESRDSEILDKSNAEVFKLDMEKAEKDGLIEPNSWEITHCGHWAVGWVDHLSFKVIDSDGNPTNAFKFITAWQYILQDYPVADDEHFANMEYEAAIECIEQSCPNIPAGFELPEDWACQVYIDLGDNGKDVYNGYVDEEDIKEAFDNLGWLGCSDCEGDGWIYDYDAKQMIIPVIDEGDKGWELLKLICIECDGTGKAPER